MHCFAFSPGGINIQINTAPAFCEDKLSEKITSIISAIVLLQIAELKRGAEIIVCTPGRMIDMLGANSGEFLHLDTLMSLLCKCS